MNASPDRNLAMELARVTEAAAMAAGRWMGRGNKEAADQAAVDAMRLVLNTVEMDGIIVIGEGEKDEAPMLYNGEHLGTGNPPLVDIAGALMTAIADTGIDVLMGIGGSPEAVVSACALKCVGGDMQCKLWPRNDEERDAALQDGMDLDTVLGIDDLVQGNNVFFSATGITDGQLLEGVRYFGGGAKTHTLVMDSVSLSVEIRESAGRHGMPEPPGRSWP